ncbi:GNAT family N-acetyltransferase [Paenibacillus sp. NEAU-GSW1]|uniref:GNAT family N-acetyltransferase n=1 Tax=Paenibacillus sp. NEAU-GSW1 TaxID=2682486 RepID=UPI0012E1C5E1|nr:GNAT family N-acetyltransferase [Paenibacillus sp. NEAU-GSW1]MUT65189.1 GNAT family N-acetyltransferase [Paenibacillus sp. NEAU-GSW1]
MFEFKGLEGERVKLVPLQLEHAEPLFECSRYPEIWESYPFRIDTLEEMRKFVQKALDLRDRNEQFPFAVYDKVRNEFVGTTRFLRISEDNNNLNIGSTWYSKAVWRTRVNTEAKYLLLKYAFEQLQAVRVEIVTTTTNERSQRAIERLGAVREGLLRKKYYGLDYYIYGFIDSDWPSVKERLEGFLQDRVEQSVLKEH